MDYNRLLKGKKISLGLDSVGCLGNESWYDHLLEF